MNMDWDRFAKVKEVLDEAGIRPLIGVVPFPEDDNLDRIGLSEGVTPNTYLPVDKWPDSVRSAVPDTEESYAAFLRELKGKDWIIALHGYKHMYTSKRRGIFPLNNFSEYVGVSYYEQLRMIKEGINKLTEIGIPPELFMAPAHSYDKNTLRALAAAGLTRVTDGFGTRPYIRPVRGMNKTDGVRFYPICRKRSECTSIKDGYTTLVLHCNTMNDEDIDALRKLLKEYRDCFIDYREYLTEGAMIRGMAGNVTEYLTACAKHIFSRFKMMISG